MLLTAELVIAGSSEGRFEAKRDFEVKSGKSVAMGLSVSENHKFSMKLSVYPLKFCT